MPQVKQTIRNAFMLAAASLLFAMSTASGAQGILTLTPGRTAATSAGTGTAGHSGDTGAASSATLFNPSGAVYDAVGDLYVSDARNNVVRMIAAGSGTITTVAGSGAQGYTGDGGAATAASLDQPMGLALDAGGNLYIADSHNHVVRKVTGTTIGTVAGTGTAGFSGDSGAATAATLYLPQGVAVDTSGNLYIADTGNHRIRKVTGTTIATIAGTGNEAYLGDGGAATAASLDMPAGLALDASGNLYIADSHNHTVRKITGTTISTVAGSGTAGFAGDGGAATAAALFLPQAVALDASGNVYIADTRNQRIREVGNGSVTTIAGSGNQNFVDGGLATSASLDTPRGLATDASGNVAVADTLNQRVRLIGLPVVTFASTAVGATSASQTVVLGNMGTASLTVSSESLAAGFTVSGGSCGATPISIAANASCSVTLVFTPTATGVATGAVAFGGAGLVSQGLIATGVGTLGSKTITFTQPATPAGQGSNAALTATASNGDPVMFSVTAGTGTASISGNVITYLTAGTVTVSADSAATSSYNAAPTVSYTVTIADVPYVFIAGSGDVDSLNAYGIVSSSAVAGGGKGAAVDANGYVWSINANGTSLSTFTPAGALGSSYTPTGVTGASALAIDGNNNVIVANGTGTISVVSNAGVALSTTAGSASAAPSGVAVDNSGNIWISNPTKNTVDEIIGGAAPAAPLANAVLNKTPATKP